MTNRVSTLKDSPAQRAAIAAAADDNADNDQAARVNYGRVELHAGLDDRPLDSDRR